MASDLTTKLHIDGAWDGSGDGVSEVVNPAAEEVVGRVPTATPADARRAIAAARRAFDPWPTRC